MCGWLVPESEGSLRSFASLNTTEASGKTKLRVNSILILTVRGTLLYSSPSKVFAVENLCGAS